ncbi:MFS transporter [Ktedonospora formicarum]|uniref:MFS transporter n=1 Tax=Ktedonospora formicarum TaxID=2778364 RepID=A0A8J3MT97_9CHLR|nr:MFS transporter [Ktedonospora formicarum]GHO47997.1 MFS transporter [Ktedonospora formicarum]
MGKVRRTNKVVTLIVACLGSFMIQLDNSIIILALPKIQASLHTSLSGLQWTIDAYTLILAALMLTGGTLGDRFGRKRFFLIGLALFTIGSALCGFASTLSWLLFGRVVQGVGAAALTTNSLALLAVAFPEAKERAQAIGLFTGLSGVAVSVGPLIGGVLTQIGNWPTIFFVNVPIGLLTLLLALPSLPESRDPNARRIDLPGQVLVIAGLTCLVTALIESSSAGWTSPLILALIALAVVFLVAFIFVEARVREPLVPLQLFGIRVFTAANLLTLILSCGTVGPVFFLAQYFQEVQGHSVLEAALCTLPISIGVFMTAPLAGRLAARFGVRLPIVVGGLIYGCSMLLLTRLEPDSPYISVWWILGMAGIGFGLCLSPLAAAVLSATPPQRAGLGSSLFNANRQVGLTLSIAVLGTIVLQQFPTNITGQLIGRGVPASMSEDIAHKVAAAGGQASHSAALGQLPITPSALQQALNQAFVDSLHVMFFIAGIAVFAVAIMAAVLLRQTRREEKREVADAPMATEEPLVIATITEES